MLLGRPFFADPIIKGWPVIVNEQTVFVREDLALERDLRRPAGSFKPTVVRLLANPPKLKPKPAWLSALASPAPPAAMREAPKSRWTSAISALWKALRRRSD